MNKNVLFDYPNHLYSFLLPWDKILKEGERSLIHILTGSL